MKNNERPRLSVLAMGFSWGAFLAVIIFILSLWCSFTGFAEKFLAVFNYLNPNPYQVVYSYALSAWSNFISNIPGILINTFYALIDGVIMGFLLGVFYNISLNILEKKAGEYVTGEVEAEESSE
jgi:hypothetical protein